MPPQLVQPAIRYPSDRRVMASLFERFLAARPAAYWPLDETTGIAAADATGHTPAGVHAGVNVTLGQPGPEGVPAIQIDAATGYVSIGGAALNALIDGDIGSMVAWGRVINPAMWDAASGTAGYLIHLRNGAFATHYLVIGHNVADGAGTFTFRRRAGGAIATVTIATGSPTAWFCAGMSWDRAAGQLRAFFNGLLVGTAAFTDPFLSDFASAGTNVLGAGSLTLQPWIGQIAHGALWKRVLSDAEQAALAARPGIALLDYVP